jgi:uncharacterized SAM-binding protein YcdF (DUF218 family)
MKPVSNSKKPRKIILVALLGLPIVIGLFLVAFWGLGAFLVEADPLQKTDAIVVLSGAPDRLDQARRLYQNHLADWIILTRAGSNSPQADAQAAGLPGERILVSEGLVASTRDEARVVRQLMEARGLKTCTVITDPYHTQRARWIFKEAFQGSALQIRVYPVQNHWYRSTTWWFSIQGWQVTVQEYAKLFYFILKSGVDDFL